MAESGSSPGPVEDEDKRDFLTLATVAVGAVGAGAFLWPIIHSMNPSKDVLALASTEVDISQMEVGQRITVVWRGKPVFIDYRTPEEIAAAQADDEASLPDPQTDSDRVKKTEWLVVVGICTHLGCVPKGQTLGDAKGEYGGWFCPCHGSHYDTSGRIRKGPAPRNMDIPPYEFLDDTTVKIG